MGGTREGLRRSPGGGTYKYKPESWGVRIQTKKIRPGEGEPPKKSVLSRERGKEPRG